MIQTVLGIFFGAPKQLPTTLFPTCRPASSKLPELVLRRCSIASASILAEKRGVFFFLRHFGNHSQQKKTGHVQFPHTTPRKKYRKKNICKLRRVWCVFCLQGMIFIWKQHGNISKSHRFHPSKTEATQLPWEFTSIGTTLSNSNINSFLALLKGKERKLHLLHVSIYNVFPVVWLIYIYTCFVIVCLIYVKKQLVLYA